MHRSGTSMVAAILASGGLYLGGEDDFVPVTDANPEQHFEHAQFVELNDAVLATLGAAWDVPPGRAAWLRYGRRLEPLRRRARELVQELATDVPWGWKDPRNSLTLPFWLDVVPNLRVVACYRDAVAVSHSLVRRQQYSELFGQRLWAAYNLRLVRAAPPDRTVYTAYEAYFTATRREVERLFAGAGLAASHGRLERAASLVKPSLRHHAVDYDPAGLPRVVRHARRTLLAAAGG
jgi:hypothetical protein